MIDKPTIIVHGFEVSYEINPETKKRDREVVWVNYSPAHSALLSQTRERVDFMDPSRLKIEHDDENGAKKVAFLRYRWEQIERALKAWREGHEIPVDGTPLAAWQGLNVAQAGVFRALGIKSVEQIAAIFRVPLHMLQVAAPGVQSFASNEENAIEFSVYTLRPIVSKIEDAYTALLPGGAFLKFNMDAILRGDLSARFAAYSTGIQGGFLNLNQINRLEDWPAVDGGDVYRVPLANVAR